MGGGRDIRAGVAQCGVRNVVQSRIRNAREGMLAEEEEAGLEDLHPAASELIRRIRRIRRRKQQHQPGTTVDADFGSLIKIGETCLTASAGEYPWQAAILQKEEFDNVYTCGAALLSARHLVTATHCVQQFAPEQLRVRLGEWDVHSNTEQVL